MLTLKYVKLPLYRSRTRFAIEPNAKRSFDPSSNMPSSKLNLWPDSTLSRIAVSRSVSVRITPRPLAQESSKDGIRLSLPDSFSLILVAVERIINRIENGPDGA